MIAMVNRRSSQATSVRNDGGREASAAAHMRPAAAALAALQRPEAIPREDLDISAFDEPAADQTHGPMPSLDAP